eukprot:UN05879
MLLFSNAKSAQKKTTIAQLLFSASKVIHSSKLGSTSFCLNYNEGGGAFPRIQGFLKKDYTKLLYTTGGKSYAWEDGAKSIYLIGNTFLSLFITSGRDLGLSSV